MATTGGVDDAGNLGTATVYFSVATRDAANPSLSADYSQNTDTRST